LFALDDFGAGLSSFSYLKTIPVDFLKIDGSFVRDMVEDRLDRAIVEAVNEIGHIIGTRTIAEWVGDKETLELLKTLNVDFAQGFHVERPFAMPKILQDYKSIV
jgi:EAL domain-containing protein (putative c-di-GMP-specific phosphodiesterase class I)